MAETKNGLENLGGGLFHLILVFGALIGLIYLGITGFIQSNAQLIALLSIFGFMIISTVVFARKTLFLDTKNLGTWGQNCWWFTVAFTLWAVLASNSKNTVFSVLSIGQNNLFSTVSSELPAAIRWVMNSHVIPISEESFWMFLLPWFLLSVFLVLGKRWKIFNNVWLQIIVLVIALMTSFAYFHVGKVALSAFLISAMIFRAVLVVLVYGEQKKNLIPYAAVVPAFAFGAHIGNNWGSEGFVDGLSILLGTPVLAWIIIPFYVIVFASAADYILRKIFKVDS